LIITQPPTNTITYWGDTVNLSVLVSGTDPLTYQWYYPNLSTPLSDASSGYGVGLITNTATSMLTLTYVDTAQAGNYQVIINNSLGSATSVVAHLTVNVRTPIVTNIAYLRSLLNRTTGLPTDMTNIYSVTGLVTTPFNLSTTLNSTEFFMQDGTVGICVYYGGDFGNHLPNEGDVVRAIGPMGSFNGLYQFNLSSNNPSHSVSSALSTGNPLPTPKYFNISKYSNIPYMETNIEGSLVVVSNVFLNQSSLQFASGASNITNVWHQYISLYVNPNASDVIGHDVPRIAASIVGVLSHFTTGYELDILHYSDLTSTTNIPPMPLYITGARTNYVVDWWAVSPFTLQWASSPTGTYHDLTGVTTPYTNHYDSTVKFFRLKQ
jgi:hypothetical protein